MDFICLELINFDCVTIFMTLILFCENFIFAVYIPFSLLYTNHEKLVLHLG